MKTIQYGEPAFPQPDGGLSGKSNGMTLRDYFAAAALSGSLCNSAAFDSPVAAAEWAYQFADAMITQREK